MKEIIGQSGTDAEKLAASLAHRKYVRVGGQICYMESSDSPFTSHAELAASLGVTEFAKPGDGFEKRPIVDDAGEFNKLPDGRICPSGSTSSCIIREPKTAKHETIKLLIPILGADKVYS